MSNIMSVESTRLERIEQQLQSLQQNYIILRAFATRTPNTLRAFASFAQRIANGTTSEDSSEESEDRSEDSSEESSEAIGEWTVRISPATPTPTPPPEDSNEEENDEDSKSDNEEEHSPSPSPQQQPNSTIIMNGVLAQVITVAQSNAVALDKLMIAVVTEHKALQSLEERLADYHVGALTMAITVAQKNAVSIDSINDRVTEIEINGATKEDVCTAEEDIASNEDDIESIINRIQTLETQHNHNNKTRK